MASTTVTLSLSTVAALLLASLASLAMPASAGPSSVRWIDMPEEHHATLAGHNPPQGMDESDLQSVRVPRSLSALSLGAVELAESDMAEPLPLLRMPRRAPQLESEQTQPSREWMVSSLANLNRRRRSTDLAHQLKGIRGLYEMYEPADSAVRAPRAAAWQLPVEPAPLVCDCGTDHGVAAARIARGTPKGELAKDESCYKPASPGAVPEGKLDGAVENGEEVPEELEIATIVTEDVADDQCLANLGEFSAPNPKAAKKESNKVFEAIDEIDGQSCDDFTTANDENLPEPEPEPEATQPPCKQEPKKAN